MRKEWREMKEVWNGMTMGDMELGKIKGGDREV